jgi:hypothetical protein
MAIYYHFTVLFDSGYLSCERSTPMTKHAPPASIARQDDDPCVPNDSRSGCHGVVSVQQQPGQTKIFWIDAPGSLYLYDTGGNWIDSLHMNGQFTSKVCNRFLVCANVPWFINIVVDPGSKLNFSLSSYGLGSGH